MEETPSRIQPARLEEVSEKISDALAELSAASATLGKRLHPRTAANLSDLVRIMNTYYSNLIEGHDTRPRDIERALAGNFDKDENRRNLQLEAAAHGRLQAGIDRMKSVQKFIFAVSISIGTNPPSQPNILVRINLAADLEKYGHRRF